MLKIREMITLHLHLYDIRLHSTAFSTLSHSEENESMTLD